MSPRDGGVSPVGPIGTIIIENTNLRSSGFGSSSSASANVGDIGEGHNFGIFGTKKFPGAVVNKGRRSAESDGSRSGKNIQLPVTFAKASLRLRKFI